jgi:hypothetical protein
MGRDRATARRCDVDVLPLIVQSPEAVNVTAKPDDAVAETVKSASPYVLFARGRK